MAKQTISVRKNADNTLTVRIGRYVEHVEIDPNLPRKTLEAVKWAAITANFKDFQSVVKMAENELF